MKVALVDLAVGRALDDDRGRANAAPNAEVRR